MSETGGLIFRPIKKRFPHSFSSYEPWVNPWIFKFLLLNRFFIAPFPELARFGSFAFSGATSLGLPWVRKATDVRRFPLPSGCFFTQAHGIASFYRNTFPLLLQINFHHRTVGNLSKYTYQTPGLSFWYDERAANPTWQILPCSICPGDSLRKTSVADLRLNCT